MSNTGSGAAIPRRSLSVFQRRFMRRLSVGVKLWISTAILATPLLGLGIFYVQSLTATLWFTETEQQGLALFRPLDRFERQITRHADLAAVEAASGRGDSPQMQQLFADADQQLAAFKVVEAQHGNSVTDTQLQDLVQKWAALKAARPISIEASLAAHDSLLDAAVVLRGQIGSDWQLTLDPELAAYNLIDVALLKLPDAARYVGEARARVVDTFPHGEYSPDSGFRTATLIALVADRLAATRDELAQATQAAGDRPTLAAALNGVPKDWDAAASTWLLHASNELRTGRPTQDGMRSLLTASDSLAQSLSAMQDQVLAAADLALNIREAKQSRQAVVALSGSAIALAAAVLLMLALVKRIAGAIRRLLNITERIADGHYDNAIDEGGRDEISRLYAGVAQMQRKLKTQIEAERAQSLENGRIRAALDTVTSSVLVADADGRIIYTNAAIQTLLREIEPDIRKDVPQFSAAAVIGSNLNMLHRSPGGDRRLLENLQGAHTFQAVMGGRTLRMVASSVTDASGVRIGNVVEWVDRTTEVAVERELQAMLTAVLGGNLRERIDTRGKSGFFETLSHGVNQLAENMLDLVSKVKEAASEVCRGAEEISQGNTNLSARTEQQASSLERTASSMEQMNSTVRQNADNAAQANQLAGAARIQAENGGAVVGKAVEAMTRINESARKIAAIIGVIDEIAFQTNLLALNAAVEAARAGEQGRGFAVVATEVRSLAGRSAKAAHEIKELILDSVKKVEDGSVLVTRSGQTLGDIVIAVKKVSDIVGEIAAASRDQSTGIDQVNHSVSQMDEMTQQNAALVEEARAASLSMADQANELNKMMERYRIGPGDVAVSTGPLAEVA